MSAITLSALIILSIAAIILFTSKWKLNAFISLFLVSLFLALAILPSTEVMAMMKEGFGNTMASTGFLIILGAIIAIVLDKTGAALVLARYILSKTGERNAAAALGITGLLAGLTIFCDSGFIILSGLAKSFSTKTKIAMPMIAGVLGCALYSVHCLVPTHPGALAAAGILQANLGNLVLLGSLFAIPGFVVSYFWVAKMTNGKNYSPSIIEMTDEKNEQAPSVLASLLPIVAPLLLIALGSLLSVINPNNDNSLLKVTVFFGQPIISLLVGVGFALLLLKNRKIDSINSIFETAIEKAGPILIVTAAGGMFGMIIKATGVGTIAGEALADTGLGLLVPFSIALILKTAQGSSTVAIITAASIVMPMLAPLNLDSESGKLLTLLALGSGSMMVSHANDSYFWVITKFSGIPADVTLKVFTTATAVMGITVFICVWITSLFIL